MPSHSPLPDSSTIRINLFASALYLLIWAFCPAAFASGDVLLFPQINVQHRPGDTWTLRQVKPSLDLFATWDIGPARFLAEAFIDEHDQHIERLQIGYPLGENHTLWFGRFHTPSDSWNTQYHHGAYMQTSISRPAIVEFNDHGGVLVTHNSGLLLEGRRALGDRALEWAAYFGVGPELSPTSGHHAGTHDAANEFELEDLDVLSPGQREHDVSIGAQLSYLPDDTPGHQYGVFANHTRIPVDDEDYQRLTLDTLGLFARRDLGLWHMHTALYIVRDALRHAHVTDQAHFSAAYLQLERGFSHNWTGYGRIENSWSTDDSAYLDLAPDFVRKRGLLGLRHDLTANQALTVEASRNQDAHDQYTQIQFSWSAVLP